MYHQANIGFVDAHAKSVGGHDNLQFPALEGVLNIFLFMWLQPGMEVLASPSVADQKVCKLFSALSA
ncbi:hypothetical protein D3C77_736110 [compost metagenome]